MIKGWDQKAEIVLQRANHIAPNSEPQLLLGPFLGQM
jgi:hypothetical protein